MMEKYTNFQVICEKWAPLAQEYAKLLNRYGLTTITALTVISDLGYNMKVFADEEKYLDLAVNNKRFIEEEKQISDLLYVIEKLAYTLYHIDDDLYECDEIDDEYDDDEYSLFYSDDVDYEDF